jgi:hypothetical protein
MIIHHFGGVLLPLLRSVELHLGNFHGMDDVVHADADALLDVAVKHGIKNIVLFE